MALTFLSACTFIPEGYLSVYIGKLFGTYVSLSNEEKWTHPAVSNSFLDP
jgi:hypothetical protein